MIARIVKKAFGDKSVLRNVELTIEKGERVAITGSSGAGKTTLIRILSYLDKDFEGEIKDGFEHPIAMFQDNRLVESISVLSNLLAVTDDKSAILEGLKALGLEGEEKKKVSQLSGGMKRRVALLRSLLVPFDVLFLDEPFTGLDDNTASVSSKYILSVLSGRTLAVVTHRKEDLDLLSIERIIAL